MDEDGQLCLRTQLSPQNPELVDIPLPDLLEEFIDHPVFLSVAAYETRDVEEL
jgi:hypothetical protein